MVRIKIDRMEAPKDVNKGEISVVLRLDRDTVQAYMDYHGTDVGIDLYALSRAKGDIFLTDEPIDTPETIEPTSAKDMLIQGRTLIDEGIAFIQKAHEIIHKDVFMSAKNLFPDPAKV